MRRLLATLPILLLILGFGVGASPVAAQVVVDDEIAAIIDTIVADVNQSGRYIDPASYDDGTDLDAAIDHANEAGIAIVLADVAANVESFTPLIDQKMQETGSTYTGVLSLTPMQLAAEVAGLSDVELNEAFDSLEVGFEGGGDAGAIIAFADSVTAIRSGERASSDGLDSGAVGAGAETASTSTSSSSDGGFPWFSTILASVASFFGIRYFANKRKRKRAEQAAIEVDRAEIAEQLRNNADNVIDLGDRVIASGDANVISLYEEASTTYQAVSLGLPEATTAEEIDALDDRLDQAEWQFEVITARLAGEPDPPSPAERELAANPPAPSGPALGPDESVFDTRRVPTQSRQQPQRRTSTRSSSGGLGGMFGGILGQILLGSGTPRRTSRRTQRRTASSGTWGSSRSPGRSMNDPFATARRSSGRSLGNPGRSRSSRRASGSRTRTARRASGSRSRGGRSRRR